ncbi:hypothetical protein HY031_01945 [Candidatus Gottesmanbacteria bacterium]|nr:hypothetical protein [Candidatus Gottesmanbacteria bacterium]
MKNMGVVVLILVVLGVGYVGYKYMKGQGGALQYSAPSYSGPSQASGSSAAATGNSVYSMTTGGTLGSFMTDPKGMTLYTFSKDSPGVSTCTGQCLVNWPAYLAPSTGGSLPADITLVTRPDGKMQYAWKGMPLYYYINDKNPGDTTGQGVGGVWYVAK